MKHVCLIYQTVILSLMMLCGASRHVVAQSASSGQYQVFQLYITTADGKAITSKEEYVDCHLSLDGQGAFPNLSAEAQIRGRGNSSWLWYAKKPYRIKFREKQAVLGLAKAKSWVLLANYRDVTDLMNTFVFETGQWLGLQYTNHTRYVEVYINGSYNGLYQLTEQVQQNKNRVAVSDDHGLLISLDVDDGPGESPYAADNFWSKVYKMPVAVKYPDDEFFTSNTVDSVKNVLAELEQAIKSQSWHRVEQLLDYTSVIKYLQIQELVYNVELSAPRSVYMYKDGSGKWFMGPLWDFDAGYDFDWNQMTTGHTFFTDYRETVMGTDPLKRNGNYSYVPKFFTDLFGCHDFVKAYKAQWAAVSDSIVEHSWNECMKYITNLRKGALEREDRRWPISGKNFDTEVEKMHQWLLKRRDYLTKLIANIPEPAVTNTPELVNNNGQKTVYIPKEWKNPWPSDSLLYAESDPDNKYTWSKSRSVESDNVIIFWDKYYGNTRPQDLPANDWNYVDIPDLLAKCEAFYHLEINQLGFVNPQTSNLSKYKVMVLMNHSKPGDWACYGGGYDFQVPALWLNAATCKPVGHSVAHEVGHSFHYMCYAEHSGHQDSSTDNTGFHLACGNGQAIWEQTAQWQAAQSYPELMFDQSMGIFRYTHNYAFSHEWHRYQSYWFLYWLNQHYGDITTVAQVWNQPMTGQSEHNGSDFNEALMKLKGLSVRELYKMYFDYACSLVTWDLEACRPYRDPYIGNFEYRCVLTDEGAYRVALASCPQGTGFNVIPLQVPAAGTEIKASLTGLNVGTVLLDNDPGEYFDGDSRYVKVTRRNYVNGGGRAARGFRMGYVALMEDGSCRYFSEDSVYCKGTQAVTEDYSFTLPDGVSRLWLVVSPALKTYMRHQWDDTIERDDMWPYEVRFEGTDLTPEARVYASAIIDGRAISDVTYTYDVTFPADAQWYTGTSVSVSGLAAATLGTAFQLQPTDIANRMQQWDERGPANNRIMFYAVSPTNSLENSKSTANGYGHWFNASGEVCDYSFGYIYSEFDPASLSFYIGQYPGNCAEGSAYTVRQALRYRKNGSSYAQALFVFNIVVGPVASVSLRSLDYNDPTTGIPGIVNDTESGHQIFDLQGRQITNFNLRHGIYIRNGKKYVVK